MKLMLRDMNSKSVGKRKKERVLKVESERSINGFEC
jgi:hypothetical protein